MSRVIRASGQGIMPDFRYTGDYDDVVEFGVVTHSALSLISALPPFSREVFEADFCPSAVLLVDPSGSTLTVSRSVDGASTFTSVVPTREMLRVTPPSMRLGR